MDGVFIIDKPEGMTSHDVVQAIRKKFNVSKAGHLGTLDPMATGVLPVAVGKAVRLVQFIPSSPKEYDGEMRFGFATDTYDRQGVPTTEERPLRGNVEAEMQQLTGLIDQTPPAFSAKKIDGVRAYRLARRQQEVRPRAVHVEIREFRMLSLDPPLMRFHVICSPGTYIRSLAHDLGQRLGCGAHLTALRRTRSGEFRLESAVALQDASEKELIPLHRLLESLPRIEVSETDEARVAHGNTIQASSRAEVAPAELARIFNQKGELLAIASVESGWARPRVVLT